MRAEKPVAMHILLVEDDDSHAEIIMRSFRDVSGEYVLKRVCSLKAARGELALYTPDLALTDYRLPDGDGHDLLAVAANAFPVIVMTSQGSEHVAVELIKSGAADYVVKSPETFSSLPRIVRIAWREWDLAREREQINSAVSRGKREWEQTFDAVPDLIAIIDSQRTITRVNRAMAQRCGLTPQDMVGRKCHEVLHGQSVPALFCQHDALLCQGRQFSYEMAEPHLNGVFDVTVTPLYDDAGQVTASVHVARDITERKRKDDALRESEQKLKAILDASTAGVISTRPDGSVIFFNSRIPEMFGYSSEELLKVRYQDLVHPDQRHIGDVGLNGLVTGKLDSITTERHYLRKDGSSFWGYISARSLVDPDGKSEAMLATITDISDIKETREALLKSSELLRLALEASTDGIWDWDLASGQIHWSPRCFSMLGYEPNEFTVSYDSWKGLIHPDDAEQVTRSAGEQIAVGEGNFVVEYRIAEKGGGWHWVKGRGKPAARDEQGAILRIVGTLTDIESRVREQSERLAFEQKLQQTQKLESLGVLAGGIAHDFNNILTIILGHCYVATQEIDSGMSLKSHLQHIESAANRAADLCRQMLAYAGKSALVQTKVDLWLLVDDIVKMLQAAIAKNVTITLDMKRDLPHIAGDTSQIQQVVMNLIINAAEAIGDHNGTIAISLQKVSLVKELEADIAGNPFAAGVYALLQVSDTGCGMDQETQKRIFEPFFTTKFAGRGLGMSAVLGIVKSHEGFMTLQSSPDAGSTFKVYFPLSRLPEEPPEQDILVAWSAPAVDSKGTILLVDDEAEVRRVGSALLDGLGFNVISVSNGSEALQAFSEGGTGIDLVLLDLIMPEMGGAETYRQLRKLAPTVPVIFLSGSDLEPLLVELKNDPHASALNKPYKPGLLREAVMKYLGEAR